MTITLDTKNLGISSFDENVETFASFTDEWENQEYKKKIKVFGTIKTWQLECFENDIAWSSSVVKHFQDKAKAGNAVVFDINETEMHHVATYNVYILSVVLAYDRGTPSKRVFTLFLQEAV